MSSQQTFESMFDFTRSQGGTDWQKLERTIKPSINKNMGTDYSHILVVNVNSLNISGWQFGRIYQNLKYM